MTQRRVVLSGCSGGGKSTLLQEMAHRGFATIPEPGRRVIAQARRTGGNALPWIDLAAFCHEVIELAIADMNEAQGELVIFDRSALDALVWFDHSKTPIPADIRRSILGLGYERCIYLTPPWPEIFEQDKDRQHDMAAALAEYVSLCDRLPSYGYRTVSIPKRPVAERADWLQEQLGKGQIE